MSPPGKDILLSHHRITIQIRASTLRIPCRLICRPHWSFPVVSILSSVAKDPPQGHVLRLVVSLDASSQESFLSLSLTFMTLTLLKITAYLLIYVDLFLRERQRQNTSGGGTEREGDTGSEAGSGLRAVSTEPDLGLELTNREMVT